MKPDFRKRRETDFWKAVNQFLVFLIAISGVVAMGVMFVPELRRIDEMEKAYVALEGEREAEELRLRQQQREENWLKTDPEYVELLARERLGMMKEGETVFRLDADAPPMPVFPGDEAVVESGAAADES